jgi:hypothetical protein
VQENAVLLVMNVTSGRNCGELFAKLNRDGFWVKTSQDSVQVRMDGSSVEYCETWPRWGMLLGGVVGELPILEPVTGENEYSLLPTLMGEAVDMKCPGKEFCGNRHSLKLGQALNMLPTPRANERGAYQRDRGIKGKERPILLGAIRLLPTLRANDNDQGNHEAIREAGSSWKGQNRGSTVSTAIAMLPTCTSRDHKDTGNLENVPVNSLLGRELGKNHGLKLQPAFAEWMMGFPEGWTALDVSEMPSSRNKSIRSSKRSRISKTGKHPDEQAQQGNNNRMEQ